MGPLPQVTQDRLMAQVNKYSNPSFLAYEWIEFCETIRTKLAKFLHSKADQISLNTSTSEVISTLAQGLMLSGNDSVALIEGEYPSDVLPWLHFQSDRVKFYPRALILDPKKLVASLDPNTKVLNLSHVSFQTGDRIDLKSLILALSKKNIFLVVDVTQSLGAVKLSEQEISGIDLLVCSPYKWLLSPYGQAFAKWSDRLMEKVSPLQVGWMSMPQSPRNLTDYTTNIKSGARKFDRGQAANMLGLEGLDASLDIFLEIGVQKIADYNQSLVNSFLNSSKGMPFELLTKTDLKSSILCIRSEKLDADKLKQKLRDANIDVSVREGNLRISFHLFNSQSDVEALSSAIL